MRGEVPPPLQEEVGVFANEISGSHGAAVSEVLDMSKTDTHKQKGLRKGLLQFPENPSSKLCFPLHEDLAEVVWK